MSRQSGYRVTLTGWITFAKGDLDAQHDAITAIRAGTTAPATLAGKLGHVKIETRQSSFDPDEATQVRKTRKAGGK